MYQRDPLSVRFDPQARLAIRLAIDQHEKRRRNERLVPYVRIRVPNVPGEIARDAGGLSKTERAFQRSLYYDGRIHHVDPRRHPDALWSLRADWDPAPLLPGAPRYVKLTVFDETDGARHTKRTRRRDRWTQNPDLQSGGIGSPHQRFPG